MESDINRAEKFNNCIFQNNLYLNDNAAYKLREKMSFYDCVNSSLIFLAPFSRKSLVVFKVEFPYEFY